MSAVGKVEARGDGAANLNGMMIDAATTRIFEVALDRARRCGLPPDMTDARPRVVELWDRYAQLGIDDVPIASRTCPGAPGLPVLEHWTEAGVGVLEDLHRASTVDVT